MSEEADIEAFDAEETTIISNDGDPLMTVFVIGVMVLLFGLGLLLLIANHRPPAGL